MEVRLGLHLFFFKVETVKKRLTEEVECERRQRMKSVGDHQVSIRISGWGRILCTQGPVTGVFYFFLATHASTRDVTATLVGV